MSDKPCPLCGREMTAIETHAGRGELYCGHCDLIIGGNEPKTPDELMALLGQRTCRNIAELNEKGVSGYFFVCSECGLSVHANFDIDKTNYPDRKPDGSIDLHTFNSNGKYKFERCPRCGRKVTE